MKAAVLHGNYDLRYEEWPEPQVKPGYVKMKVCACGVCGSDMPRITSNGAHYYPIVLGHEFSGYITEVGEGVTSLKPGDHTAAVPLVPCLECEDCKKGYYSLCKHYSFIGSREQGGYGEYVVLPERNAVKIDDSIPWEVGALFEPSSVAIHGIRQAGDIKGKTAAVIGCGIIGILTAQWARILGASKVVVFNRNEKRLELAKRTGADETVTTKDEFFVEKAYELTEGRGFDFVYECVGAQPTIVQALKLVANHGTICMIGTPKGEVTLTQREWEYINRKECFITGSWMSGCAPFPGDEWQMTSECFADGRLIFDPEMLYKKVPVTHPEEVTEILKSGEPVNGRIVLMHEASEEKE